MVFSAVLVQRFCLRIWAADLHSEVYRKECGRKPGGLHRFVRNPGTALWEVAFRLNSKP
jgi:hypothetical protein